MTNSEAVFPLHFLSGRRLYYWFQLVGTQLSAHHHLDSKKSKKKKKSYFPSKKFNYKALLSDSQSGVWHWKYLLHQELFSAQPWSFKQPRYQLLSFTLKRGHCHSWIFFFKWLEKSPSLNTVRVKINFKRLPGSASVLHNSVKSVIESPGQRASLFLFFFFFLLDFITVLRWPQVI